MIGWSNVRRASAFPAISLLIQKTKLLSAFCDNHRIDTQHNEWCLSHGPAEALEIDFRIQCISITLSVMDYANAAV